MGRAHRRCPPITLYGIGIEGITLVNIGIGPSNAKTITDHLAVLQSPLLDHGRATAAVCVRHSCLGDYVLAHAYARSDNVLDEDLPDWVPVPPIAEIQVALTEAVGSGHWALRRSSSRPGCARARSSPPTTAIGNCAIASCLGACTSLAPSPSIWSLPPLPPTATAFGCLTAPLLCVSDKPLHGELKLPGHGQGLLSASASASICKIGITAVQNLSDEGIEALHSRKLRSFDEPAFR